MFTLLKWKLLNYRYCLTCHKMTRHYEDYIEHTCSLCNGSKCSHTYSSIINKYRMNESITVSKDKATNIFKEYLISNYYQDRGLLRCKHTDEIIFSNVISDVEIYKQYLIYRLTIRSIQSDKRIKRIETIVAYTFCALCIILAIYLQCFKK